MSKSPKEKANFTTNNPDFTIVLPKPSSNFTLIAKGKDSITIKIKDSHV